MVDAVSYLGTAEEDSVGGQDRYIVIDESGPKMPAAEGSLRPGLGAPVVGHTPLPP